jgi:hypothetical protein
MPDAGGMKFTDTVDNLFRGPSAQYRAAASRKSIA